jgi:hypothetical protein
MAVAVAHQSEKRAVADRLEWRAQLARERGDLMPELGYRRVNKYLPPRARNACAATAPAPALKPAAPVGGFLGCDALLWLRTGGGPSTLIGGALAPEGPAPAGRLEGCGPGGAGARGYGSRRAGVARAPHHEG